MTNPTLTAFEASPDEGQGLARDMRVRWALEEGSLALFESGSIILHLAETHAGLLPADPVARKRAITWMFAALNTVEPPIVELEQCTLVESDKPWYGERLPLLEERILHRLGPLSRRLGDADWLEGEFTAGDLMMVMVLRRAEGTGLLERFPNLVAYKVRGESRPAYRRAFAAQRAVFTNLHR